MSFIKVNNLTRDFEYFEKSEGFNGSFKSLFKREKKVRNAVTDFSFTMNKGEILGLIGPNGAGKTTLIKMMTGIIKPTSGEIIVDGFIPSQLKNAYKKKYAVVMGQKTQLWWDLPAMDSFVLNREIYNIPHDKFQERLDTLLELFDVKDFINVQVRKLSLGQRMKMEIILSLLHGPEILFLDEPTIGLDIIAQKQMREFLKTINAKTDVSIILTSHYMEDIKELCERVVVINDGKKVFDGSFEKLAETKEQKRIITITFNEEYEVPKDISGVICEASQYKLTVKCDKRQGNQLISSLINKYQIEDIKIDEEDISDIIEALYQNKKAGDCIE